MGSSLAVNKDQYSLNLPSGRAALMTHLVLGYPSLELNAALVETLVEAGTELIELQIPFSDPIADGPTIMNACQDALAGGVRVAACLDFAAKMVARHPQTNFLIMTYANIPFHYGMERFCRDCARAGLKGLIVPDLPPDERSERYPELCREYGLFPVLVLSPVTTVARMQFLAGFAAGFVYSTSRVGITGNQCEFKQELFDFFKQLKETIPLPLAVGFGITTPEQYQEIAEQADIVVIGSKLISLYQAAVQADTDPLQAIAAFVRSLRAV